MPEIRHMAIDLGAESGRAIVGKIVDDKLTLEEIYRFPTQGMYVNGSFRWDVYRFFSEIKNSLKKYVEIFGPELASIGVDTWGVDFGLLDKKGKLIGIPYHYRDSRTEGADELINTRLGNERLYDKTGIQLLPFNTINQLVAMKRDEDPSLDISSELLFIGDLLHFFLSGVAVSEYTVASISQLYNYSKDDWDDDILDAFSLPSGLKTKMIKAGDVIGPLKSDIAEDCGLSGSVMVVAPAVHDTASAAAAVPAEGDNWAYISSGTWSIAGLELPEAIAGKESFKLNISNSGGVFGKILFLKNIMGLWVIQQCKKEWNRRDPSLDYEAIVQLTNDAEPFAAYIDLDDNSFLNPANMPEAIVSYLQKTGQITPDVDNVGQISRLVFENLAFKYRAVFEKLKSVTKKDFDTLHIIGGGSQNKTLNNYTANALNVTVKTGPVEASAIGNIMMQAYGSGYVKSHDEIRQMVSWSFPVEEIKPDSADLWDEKYQEYLKLLLN